MCFGVLYVYWPPSLVQPSTATCAQHITYRASAQGIGKDAIAAIVAEIRAAALKDLDKEVPKKPHKRLHECGHPPLLLEPWLLWPES